MTEQSLDLRGSLHIIRRHLAWVAVVMAAGLLGGIGYGLLSPPVLTSNILVALPTSTRDASAQIVIASSEPVLANAGSNLSPATSPQALRSQVQVTDLTPYLLLISGNGRTAAQAESIAKAVADSYVDYLTSPDNPNGLVQAQVLEGPTNATGMRLSADLLITCGVGILSGALIGTIAVLAISRKDQRLQERDQIADAIGIPVLASLPVRRPPNAASWSRLFEDYEPGAAEAWQLRSALKQLELIDVNVAGSGGQGSSLMVLSLSSDRRALALGPQLAAFTASLGIPTALLVGPQHDANTTDALRAACAAPLPPSGRSSQLRVVVTDHDDPYQQPDAMLTVVVAVVNGKTPQVADAVRATVTVLGVSAGAATSEELVRVAASVAADGRSIAGILIADPNPTDETTGRLPQLARPAQRIMPTRMTGTVARG